MDKCCYFNNNTYKKKKLTKIIIKINNLTIIQNSKMQTYMNFEQYTVPFWSQHSKPGEYNPPPYGWYQIIPVSVTPEQMKKVIGKDGICFKAITHQVPGILYIWHNRSNNTIEIYGLNPNGIIEAINRLNTRMYDIYMDDLYLSTKITGKWADVEEDE
jgi:hypothetical protein